jgi:hypothetical protein
MPSNGQSNGGSNVDKLQEAGLITGELEEPYVHAINGLSKHEVDVLLAVKKRLDAADLWHASALPQPRMDLPNFTRCIIF